MNNRNIPLWRFCWFFEIENSVFKKTNTSDSDAKSTKPSYDFGKDYAMLMNAFMKRYFIELEVKPNRKSARTMTRDTLFTYSECNSEVTTNPVHPVRSKTNSEMLKLLLVTTFGRWARREAWILCGLCQPSSTAGVFESIDESLPFFIQFRQRKGEKTRLQN